MKADKNSSSSATEQMAELKFPLQPDSQHLSGPVAELTEKLEYAWQVSRNNRDIYQFGTPEKDGAMIGLVVVTEHLRSLGVPNRLVELFVHLLNEIGDSQIGAVSGPILALPEAVRQSKPQDSARKWERKLRLAGALEINMAMRKKLGLTLIDAAREVGNAAGEKPERIIEWRADAKQGKKIPRTPGIGAWDAAVATVAKLKDGSISVEQAQLVALNLINGK